MATIGDTPMTAEDTAALVARAEREEGRLRALTTDPYAGRGTAVHEMHVGFGRRRAPWLTAAL